MGLFSAKTSVRKLQKKWPNLHIEYSHKLLSPQMVTQHHLKLHKLTIRGYVLLNTLIHVN